jgi:hypothetical protein
MGSGRSDFPCFLDDQKSGPPASLKKYPDREYALSLMTDPQIGIWKAD